MFLEDRIKQLNRDLERKKNKSNPKIEQKDNNKIKLGNYRDLDECVEDYVPDLDYDE